MAKQIKATDIFESEDIFRGIRQSAEQAIDTLGKFKTELKQTADELKKTIGGATVGDTKSINELIAATQKANQVKEQTVKIDQEQEKLRKLSIQSEREEIKLKKDQQAALDREAKAREKVARETAKQNSAYSQESAKLNELRKRYKDLAVQNKENTAEARKLLNEIGALDTKLKQIDATVGQHQRNVGNYADSMKGLQSTLSTFGVAFGIGEIAGGIFNISKELDTATNTARMFFNETQAASQKLAESAIVIGKSWGKETNEVLAAANVLTKEFGISGEEALDRINVGFTKGGDVQGELIQNIKEYSSQLSYAGLNADETIAIITQSQQQGVFSDKGVDAIKEAALSLREMTQPAQDALAAIGMSGTELQAQIESGELTYFEAIQKISAKTAEFGQGSREAGMILADVFKGAGEDAGRFIFSLDELNLNLDQMDDQSKGLSGAIGNLTQKFYEFIFGLNDSAGVTGKLATVINFLANNLGTIVGVIGKLVVAWGAYKTLQLGLMAIEKARAFSFAEFGKNLAAQIPLTKQYATAQKEAAAASKASGESAKTAGSAMSAVPWMVILGLLIEVATAFYDIASGANAAAEAQARLDKTTEGSLKNATERTQKRQDDLQKEIAALQDLRNENKITEEQFLKRKQYAINLTQKQIQTDIKSVNERKKGYLSEIKELENIQKNVSVITQQGQKTYIGSPEDVKRYKELEKSGTTLNDAIAQLRANMAGADVKIVEYRKELDATSEAQKRATSDVNANSNAQKNNTGKIGAKIPKIKELNTEMEKYNEYLTKQNELLYDQEQFDTEQKIKAVSDEISNLTEDALLKSEGGRKPDISLLQDKMEQKLNLEKDLIGERLKMELQAIEDRYKAESDRAKEQITSNYQKLIGQDGLTAEQRKKIDEQYKQQLAQFDLDELQRNADKQLELKLTKEKALAEGVELDKKYGEETIQLKNDINDKLTESEQRRLDREKQKEEEAQERLKQQLENRNEWAKFATDYFIEQSNKRIAQLDKEIAAAEKQQDTLRELAANGNINARESLAENQRIIDEANRKKAQEERRKQMIELVSGVYQTYNQKVAANAENPLMETIRDTVLLQQFANTLMGNMPTFFDGTENTGKHGEGVDGKGGFHAILHPNERVVPKSLNEKIGSLSNEQLAKVAQEYQNGKLITGTQPMSAIDLSLLVNEMKDLKDVIRNKPETNIELGEITSSVMEIVKTTKQGNTLKTNRFKIRK